jgi:hypothetical protein
LKLGFTGTQNGMSIQQMKSLRILLEELKPFEFHHGDCIGADEESHDIVSTFWKSAVIVIHPPDIDKKRAFCRGHLVLQPKPYLERDRDIVDATDVLVAAPKDENTEEVRSGTWYTVRYARKQDKRVIILPRGEG